MRRCPEHSLCEEHEEQVPYCQCTECNIGAQCLAYHEFEAMEAEGEQRLSCTPERDQDTAEEVSNSVNGYEYGTESGIDGEDTSGDEKQPSKRSPVRARQARSVNVRSPIQERRDARAAKHKLQKIQGSGPKFFTFSDESIERYHRTMGGGQRNPVPAGCKRRLQFRTLSKDSVIKQVGGEESLYGTQFENDGRARKLGRRTRDEDCTTGIPRTTGPSDSDERRTPVRLAEMGEGEQRQVAGGEEEEAARGSRSDRGDLEQEGTKRKRREVSGGRESDGEGVQREQEPGPSTTTRDAADERGPVLWTTVIHGTASLETTRGKGPTFITATHKEKEEHIHIVFKSGINNVRRQWKRIGSYLGLSESQIIEGNLALQRVSNYQRFWLYLIRYGSEWIKVFNQPKNNPTLKDLFQYLHITTSDVSTQHACMHMHALREERRNKAKDRGADKSGDLREYMYDKAQDIIGKYKPTSIGHLERMVTEEEFRLIYKVYGTSYRAYLGPLVKRYNNNKTREERNRNAKDVLCGDEDTEEVEPEQVRWWFNYFAGQGIDALEFLMSVVDIINMKDFKVNTLVLIGKSNAGKSLLIRCLLDQYNTAYVTRSGENNQFHFQNLLNKNIGIFEEPRIHPNNVDDYKLLFGGESFEINVKNQDQEVLRRIPIFVSTNTPLGYWINETDNIAITNRCKTYKFTKAIGEGDIPKPDFDVQGRSLREFFKQVWQESEQLLLGLEPLAQLEEGSLIWSVQENRLRLQRESKEQPKASNNSQVRCQRERPKTLSTRRKKVLVDLQEWMNTFSNSRDHESTSETLECDETLRSGSITPSLRIL